MGGGTKLVDRAVVLLSGGLDSTTCMALAQEQGYELVPLSFDYGQRHRIELQAAQKVAAYFGAAESQHVVHTDFGKMGGSALTDPEQQVPSGQPDAEGIPSTFVPGRNLVFLAYAFGLAGVTGASVIYTGVNHVDYSGYPDCRPEFIRAAQAAGQLALGETSQAVSVCTPLAEMSKADIVRTGARLGAPYQLTTSCYNGGEEACGECDSCLLRLRGFRQAGYRDPVAYAREIDWAGAKPYQGGDD